MNRAVDACDDEIASEARSAIANIKASNYNPRVISSQLKKLAKGTESTLRQSVADQIFWAAHYQTRQEYVYKQFAIEGRAESMGELVTSGDVSRALARVDVATSAMIAREKNAPLVQTRSREEVARLLKTDIATVKEKLPSTYAGDRLAKRLTEDGALKVSREVSLSTRIHKGVDRATRETRTALNAAIRESQNFDMAGRELIRISKMSGAEIGKVDLTKRLQRLKQSGNRLLSMGDDASLKDFKRQVRNLEKYAGGLADDRGRYIELLQDIRKRGPAGLDNALEKWTAQTQRYNAERILRTEAQSAFRMREYESIKNTAWITAVIWRRNTGARKSQRKQIIKKAARAGVKAAASRPCICDRMADKKYSKEMMEMYPRMGHPHCSCYWESVIDMKASDEAAYQQLVEEMGELD